MLETGQEGWRFDPGVGEADFVACARGPGIEVLLCLPHVAQPLVDPSVLAVRRVSAVVVLPESGANADHCNNHNNRSERKDKREGWGHLT